MDSSVHRMSDVISPESVLRDDFQSENFSENRFLKS